MSRSIALVWALCFPTLLFAGNAQPSSKPPSKDALGMCGALGVVTFIPEEWEFEGPRVLIEGAGPTTWWKDTDGVDPGVAGCHLELHVDGESGRAFGEACLDETLLLETNPGQAVEHPHHNDIGHPDIFDCHMWCRGQGAEGGVCNKVESSQLPDGFLCKSSARCECSSTD